MAKKIVSNSPYVYSTNPHFTAFDEASNGHEVLPAGEQKIKVRLETKHRAGKAVTLVQHFSGTEEQMETVGKQLKSFCGTGGSVKNGEIIVQGDSRDRVLQWLHKNGYMKAVKI